MLAHHQFHNKLVFLLYFTVTILIAINNCRQIGGQRRSIWSTVTLNPQQSAPSLKSKRDRQPSPLRSWGSSSTFGRPTAPVMFARRKRPGRSIGSDWKAFGTTLPYGQKWSADSGRR